MVFGRSIAALDCGLLRGNHDGGIAYAGLRRFSHHRDDVLGAELVLFEHCRHRPQRPYDPRSGNHGTDRGRDRQHDDADAQSLARGKDHGNLRKVVPSLAGPEKRRLAADDARRIVGCAGILLYRRASRHRGADRHRGLDDGLRADRPCGPAYSNARVEGPRALARLHLRHRHRVQLVPSGNRGPRACRFHFRASPPLLAEETAARSDAVISALQLEPHTHSHHLTRRTNMEVILLERVAKLGQMGEVVRVKDGFARNFLLKRGKALRATADNRAKFEGMKVELEARNLQAKGEATKIAEKIDGRNVVVLRQASETGQLFGSVSVRDIITSFESDGVTISRSQVMLDAPIKTIGKHSIAIAVHPEVEVNVTVTVARSADEAQRINRGEDISTRREDQDAAAEALAAAGEFFDPEAQHDDLVAPQEASSDK